VCGTVRAACCALKTVTAVERQRVELTVERAHAREALLVRGQQWRWTAIAAGASVMVDGVGVTGNPIEGRY